MSKFININLENKINRKFILTHLIFLILWLLIIGVFFFRIDLNLISFLPDKFKWIQHIIPFLLVIFMFSVLKNYKWYFWLVFIFYIPLQIFWFIPKFILKRGKFYLFISYISTLFRRLKRWKSSFIHFAFILFLTFLIIKVPTDSLRILTIFFIFYIIIKLNYRYTKKSIRPASFFGVELKKHLDFDEGRKEKHIKNLEGMLEVKNKKLTKEESDIKSLTNIAYYHTFIQSFKTNLESSNGKSAFAIYWLISFFFSIFLTIVLLALINYQIYLIDENAFRIEGNVNFFEFLRYTAKSLTYGNIDEINPNNAITKVLESFVFFIIGFLYLIILIGFGWSLKNSKIEEETTIIIKSINKHLDLTQEFVNKRFNKDLIEVTKEVKTINNAVQKIKLAFEKIF